MKQQKWCVRLGAALLAAALLAGCGGSSSGAGNSAAVEYSAGDMAPAAPNGMDSSVAEGGGLQSALQPQPGSDRKMVYTANIRLESKDFDAARGALLAAVDEFGAYIEYTDLNGSAADGDRWLNYTVRVPVEHYTDFIAAAGEAGSVLDFNESADDITSNYIDVEARLDALKAQRDRLNELAAQAETTSDLIEIEAQLSEVQYQLESYTRQLRSMDDRVQYSTVDITLREVSTYTPHNPTYLERVRSAFSDGWQFFIDLLQNLSVAVIYLLPTLVLIAAIVLIVLAATRKSRAARKAKAAERAAARKAAPAPAQSPAQAAAQTPADAPAPGPQAPAPGGDSGPIYKH